MADLPEYRASTRIQPAQAVGGFSQALGAVGAATQPLSDMGYQAAQNASLEQARLAGIEAAKNPKRTLLPVITPSDAEFVKSYKNEVYNNVKFDSNKALNELYFTASKNPSNASLADFEKNAKEIIDKNLDLLPEDMRSHLKRDLEGSYESSYYQLAGSVESSNQRYLEQLNNAQYEQNSKAVYNNGRLGLKEEVERVYNEERTRIDQLEESRQLAPDEANIRRNNLLMSKEMGEIDKEVEDRIKDGTFESYAREFREKRPQHLTPSEHDALSLHMLQYGNQFNSALKAQQNLELTKAQTLYAGGDIEGAMSFRPTMGTANRADFDLYIARHSAENNRITREANSIIDNISNPVFLANTTPAPRNYAVDNILIPLAEKEKGGPLSLTEQSQLLSSNPRVPVESFQKRLSAGLSLGTPQQRLDAAQAVNIAKQNNPELIRGMSKNDLSLAGMYQKYSMDPAYQGPDGMDKIKDKLYEVNDEVLAERRRIVDTYVKDNGLKDAIYLRGRTFQALDIPQKKGVKLPAGLTQVYYNMLTENIMRTGDTTQAEQDTAFEMKQYYQESKIDDPSSNAAGKVMYMAPEHLYTNMGYILQNDKVRAIKEMVDHSKDIEANNGVVLNQLNWNNAPDTNDLTKALLHDGPVKIEVNGKERQIIVESDSTTQFSPPSEISWALGYLDDNNIFNPLINPFTPFGTYRFSPTPELYEIAGSNPNLMANVWKQETDKIYKKELSDYEQGQLQKAYKARKQEIPNTEVQGEDIYD